MGSKIWRLLKIKTQNYDGFTLLETMIGMMIFAVGISAVLYMEVRSIGDHSASRRNVTTIQGAVCQTETVGLSLDYSDPLLNQAVPDANATEEDPDPVNGQAMPVGGYENSGYSVLQNQLVLGLKMVYVSNRHKPGDRRFTLSQAVPNMRDPMDNKGH